MLPLAGKERLRAIFNLVSIRERLHGGQWSWAWGEELPFHYSASVSSGSQHGSPSIRFEWRAADYDGTRKTMSAELLTGYFKPDAVLAFSYRVYLPSQCHGLSVPLVLSQLHDMPDFHLEETWRHPIAEICLSHGELQCVFRGSSETVTPWFAGKPVYSSEQSFTLGKPLFDHWNFVSGQIQLSPHGTFGGISVQLNGVVVLRDQVHIGYNDVIGPFWKFGPYFPIVEGAPDLLTLHYEGVSVSAG